MKIKILYCNAFGEVFNNIIPNSIHDVISSPEGSRKGRKGVWVMGNGEPVKILEGEYEILKPNNK